VPYCAGIGICFAAGQSVPPSFSPTGSGLASTKGFAPILFNSSSGAGPPETPDFATTLGRQKILEKFGSFWVLWVWELEIFRRCSGRDLVWCRQPFPSYDAKREGGGEWVIGCGNVG